jgi:riboflavin kinase/FMN adenylyltransferase
LIGDDFRFGQGRKGDFHFLKGAEENYGFSVEQFDTVEDETERVSSTRIRNALADGDLDAARNLLGRAFTMTGRVVHGDKRGREWGFPTANLAIDRALPMTGVFSVKVHGARDDVTFGVANLGTRPTIGGMKTLLEVHLFDYTSDLYGRRICVEFVSKIREEKKFDSFDELKNQIMMDCETARVILMESRKTDG